MKLTLQLNGRARVLRSEALTPVLELLRGPLGQPGLPEPCGDAGCGRCAVLLDGHAVLACTVPALRVRNRDLRTPRGLGAWGEEANAVLERHGVCGGAGGCRGAVLVVLRDLHEQEQAVDEAALREALADVRCPGCGGAALIRAAREVLGVDRRG